MKPTLRTRAILSAGLVLPTWTALAADTDHDIRDRVEGALQGSAKVGHLSLSADVQGGTVTLSGRVLVLGQSWQAEEAVAAVRGVLGIVNQVEIQSRGRPDDSIEHDLPRRIEDIPVLAAAGIAAKVSGGKVTLGGQVKDARLRFRAREAAADVEGVLAVVDEISSPSTTDELILKAAKNLLGPGSFVRVAGVIRPTVEDGIVTLDGRVPRLSERRQAERLVWGINGVRGVVNQIEVIPRGVKFR